MLAKRFVTVDGLYTFPDARIQSFNGRFGGVVTHTNRLPGTDGAYDQHGNAAAPLEVGSVRVTWGIYDDSGEDLDAQRDEILAMAAWGKGMLYAQPTITGAAERFCFARVTNISIPERPSEATEIIQTVTIDFQVTDPRWYVNRFVLVRWGLGATWGGGDVWGGSASAQACTGVSTDLATETSNGQAVTYPKITIAVPAGQSAENVTIKRIVGVSVADQVRITGTLNAGDVAVIDCAAASVTINAADAYSRLEYLTPGWMAIQPGDNRLVVEMDNAGDACTVKISYDDAYL